MRKVILGQALALVLTATHAQAGDITITDAWSRATPVAAVPGVVYFSVTDTGAPDSLTSVSTPVAKSASMHQSITENGIMQMRPVASVPVSKDHPVTFAPGSYHVMLEGLTAPLAAGASFPLTLTFEHAGRIDTTVTVKPLGTTAAPGADAGMKGMDMKGMDMKGM